MQQDPKISFLTTASRILFFGAIGLIALVVFSSPKQFFRAKSDESTDSIGSAPCPFKTFFGECRMEAPTSSLVGIMIENHPVSRPQAGLSQARIVYEAPVEGQYTRFLAIFSADQEIEKAGPVRSARPYFIDWANEYDLPLYMHVGGSNDALEKLRSSPIIDVNEMSRGQFFWRDGVRFAPHNVYTNTLLWQKARHTLTSSTEAYVPPWTFSEVSACTASCTAYISINYTYGFFAEWQFNTSTGRYMRFQEKEPHRDEERQIAADTIIVQFVSSTILDNVGRLAISTVSSGKALVLRDGYIFEGIWKKDTARARTRWFEADGSELSLKHGTIWVQVVNERTKVKY